MSSYTYNYLFVLNLSLYSLLLVILDLSPWLVSAGLVASDRASLWHITPVLAVSTHDPALLLVIVQTLVNSPLLQGGQLPLSTSPLWVLA